MLPIPVGAGVLLRAWFELEQWCEKRSQGKVFVVGHWCWNKIFPIKFLPPGLPIAPVIFPCPFATPVFLRIKQRNQCDATGEDKNAPTHHPLHELTKWWYPRKDEA